ncbi:MAG: FIST N-terminal domain-containing protein [Actinomycetota bacterium]
MQTATLSHIPGRGWTPGGFPDLDSERTLVVAFGAAEMRDDPRLIEELAAAYPRATIVGCSTAGEIRGDQLEDGTLTVAVARFDTVRIASARATVSGPADSAAAGETLGRALAAPDLRAVLVLSDGLRVNGSELIRGLNRTLPAGVVVTGGLAGDGDRFERTWVLDGGEPRDGIIAAAGLYGDGVRVGYGSKGGWDIFGPERRVTRSEGSVLYELDGRPALDLYRQYLGDLASGLPATGLLFPLALRARPDADRNVRTILAVDDEARTMTFAGDVPQGHLAQLMRANFDRLIDGAATAGVSAAARHTGPVLAISISCVGRRLVLGERAEEEVAATLDALPPGSQQIGFYSYGEIAPHASGRCDLHNQTMTLTTISETG